MYQLLYLLLSIVAAMHVVLSWLVAGLLIPSDNAACAFLGVFLGVELLFYGLVSTISARSDTRFVSRHERMVAQKGHTIMFVAFLGFSALAHMVMVLAGMERSTSTVHTALARQSKFMSIVHAPVHAFLLFGLAADVLPCGLRSSTNENDLTSASADDESRMLLQLCLFGAFVVYVVPKFMLKPPLSSPPQPTSSHTTTDIHSSDEESSSLVWT